MVDPNLALGLPHPFGLFSGGGVGTRNSTIGVSMEYSSLDSLSIVSKLDFVGSS